MDDLLQIPGAYTGQLVSQHEWEIKVIEVVAQSSCWIDFII